ncbi:hypothetical protein PENSPDRAFT_646699 [Peniophora sp. CONT]|nr:hypothetical protein PENSPDRAFT_646699 [Peniophora sp. CONT]
MPCRLDTLTLTTLLPPTCSTAQALSPPALLHGLQEYSSCNTAFSAHRSLLDVGRARNGLRRRIPLRNMCRRDGFGASRLLADKLGFDVVIGDMKTAPIVLSTFGAVPPKHALHVSGIQVRPSARASDWCNNA